MIDWNLVKTIFIGLILFDIVKTIGKGFGEIIIALFFGK